MRFAVILILFVLSFPTAGITQETPHLSFVSEYIRELGANENVRELSERPMRFGPSRPRASAMQPGSIPSLLRL